MVVKFTFGKAEKLVLDFCEAEKLTIWRMMSEALPFNINMQLLATVTVRVSARQNVVPAFAYSHVGDEEHRGQHSIGN